VFSASSSAGTPIVGLKILNSNGDGELSDVIDAMNWLLETRPNGTNSEPNPDGKNNAQARQTCWCCGCPFGVCAIPRFEGLPQALISSASLLNAVLACCVTISGKHAGAAVCCGSNPVVLWFWTLPQALLHLAASAVFYPCLLCHTVTNKSNNISDFCCCRRCTKLVW
jgi:hypothetical protein